MSNIIDAEYVSIWDGGSTEVHSEVKVDLDEESIVEWGKRWYVGYNPNDDSELEVLECEIVVIDGEEHTAMPADDYAQHEAEGDLDAYDDYDNGIIVYDA